MLVHAIQKRLPLHFSRLEKQLVKFPCTESQFVGVFCRYITRFSPAKSSYYCIFKGENADNILSEIFEDQQWENSQTKSSLKKLPIQPEMHIQWYTESLTDTKGHFTSSGYISMIFE
ncbi:1011_t:CDS:2 [Gigaspora rosea]|nr:1011_t:CDS:2 [Gigaspora rosea]